MLAQHDLVFTSLHFSLENTGCERSPSSSRHG